MYEPKTYNVYILFNRRNGVLYTGVTGYLPRRIGQHKTKFYNGFTKRYGVDKLGYLHPFDNVIDAIHEEKRIKAGNRQKKVEMIESINPNWDDLFDSM